MRIFESDACRIVDSIITFTQHGKVGNNIKILNEYALTADQEQEVKQLIAEAREMEHKANMIESTDDAYGEMLKAMNKLFKALSILEVVGDE